MTTKGIYIISNILDNRVYVGKFSRTPYELRKRLHLNTLKRGCHHSKKLQNFFNKYGEQSLVFNVVYESDDLTEEELNNLESEMIQDYDSFKRGFNMSLGGEGAVGVIRSKEQREKISERLKVLYADRDEAYRKAAKEANVNKKRVICGDSVYESAKEAADKNGVNYNTMIKWIRNGKNGYQYEVKENQEVNKPSIVSINGIIYSSIAQAEKAVGYSRSTIRARISDERFPDWKYIGRSNTYENSGRKSKEVRND